MNKREARMLVENGITFGQMQDILKIVEVECDLTKRSRVNKGLQKFNVFELFSRLYNGKDREQVISRGDKMGAVNFLHEFGEYLETTNSNGGADNDKPT